ncbi:hypothetical protein EVG20_g6225 [Dentipellis fragilis]|uniref:Protein kinase domain-containing protein n=1 Tax=Dentipellis fragilis TaxID=205917 RepID=A0A4Y9YM49_9AGAM|nr:hypothetical protein EVG20_g6225 [Dentipellis fragilis]
MPTLLNLHLPDQSTPIHVRSITDVSSLDGKILTFRDTTFLAYNSCTVYKGKLHISGSTVDKDAVCKLTRNNREVTAQMENEVAIYNEQLKGLQDSVVPVYYGLYKGSYERDRRVTEFLCIILEHCGTPINVEFGRLSAPLKYVAPDSSDLDFCLIFAPRLKIIDCMVDIHKAGVRHGGLWERKVLITPGGDAVRIIDFGLASVHQCRRRLKMGINHYVPLKGDFGCDELYEIGEALDIWTSRMYCTPSQLRLTHDMHILYFYDQMFVTRPPRRLN